MANGGYCCGRLAEHASGPIEITLKRPTPLETSLVLAEGELRHGDTVLAVARPVTLELALPEPVSFDHAKACEHHFIGRERHAFPGCFVCGTRRAPGDGLRIFPGRERPLDPVAAGWIPDASLSDDGRLVRSEFLWAALDCPGYFGASQRPVPALLGRLTGSIERSVRVGERLVVMGWLLGAEGRKLSAGTALWTEAGELIARSRQTWIRI